MLRKVLLTGELFTPKRINQVFSNSANRIAYHNTKANELRHYLAYINKPLQINFRICNEIMKGKKEAVFHKQFLFGKGFSFLVHNHVVSYEGENHYCVFNYILIYLGNEQIKIIVDD